MKNQPNKATVKDGLPTAEQVLRETYHEYGIEYKPSHILADSVATIAMQSYSDQQNAELLERVKELQAKIASYESAIDGLKNVIDSLYKLRS